jgi:SAM-dependent methyltransferase
MKFRREIEELVDGVISDLGSFDLNLSTLNDPSREPTQYPKRHRHEYIRTVQDCVDHFGRQKEVRVLEIGAFFGVVCICLAKLGYRVTGADVPEYMTVPEHRRRFESHGVSVAEVRLEDFLLPFEDQAFDAVIMCEVLEHLNFNPLPLIKEINRISVDGALFYLSLPNQASVYNRLALLRGRSIQISVEDFFAQLDPASGTIANGHWREYTTEDIRVMLSRLGFSIKRQYYFSLGECLPRTSVRKWFARLLYETLPQLKENQTTLAIKESRPQLVFTIPKTVHRTLQSI